MSVEVTTNQIFQENKMNKFIPILTIAASALTAQVTEAGQLFAFAPPPASASAAPSFTIPSQHGYMGYYTSSYVKGLRVAGVLDWIKPYSLTTTSLPNAAGQRRKTQTCATEFHHPLTGVLVYRTPLQSLVSALYGASAYVYAGCGASPINQAGNPIGLIAEAVNMQTQIYAPTASNTTSVKIRVIHGGTKALKWTGTLVSTAALGYPSVGDIIDVNGDGTDEFVVTYNKNVTPVGFAGTKTQYTRQVRNSVTGAIMSTYAWIETQVQ